MQDKKKLNEEIIDYEKFYGCLKCYGYMSDCVDYCPIKREIKNDN